MAFSAATTFRRLVQLLFFATSFIGLILCPHSKVEESFQLQAVHDLFYYGVKPALSSSCEKLLPSSPAFSSLLRLISNTQAGNEDGDNASVLPYDHLKYPGVVPRTFTGPVILSTLCHAARWFLLLNTPNSRVDLMDYPMVVQFLARLFLLIFNLHAWFRFASAVDSRAGGNKTIGTYLLLATACQFHLPFYASRMLPNTFATILALHAYGCWVSNRVPAAAAILVADMIIFRCDVLLLLASAGLVWLFVSRQLTIFQSLKIGISTVAASLAATVPLDSVLWQYWVWPEGTVLYYNTVLGKSSNWGVSPWYWYWAWALPKALLATAILVPLSIFRIPERWGRFVLRGERLPNNFDLGLWVDAEWLPFVLTALGYVGLYSCLGHKEMRFLFPVLPLFNLAAAIGFARVHSNLVFPVSSGKKDDDGRSSTKLNVMQKLAFIGCAMSLLVTLAASMAFVAVSRWNYPGGDALAQLIDIVATEDRQRGGKELRVFVDVASAMTGVSKFGESAASAKTANSNLTWTFDKAGYEEENAANYDAMSSYTHILSENKNVVTGGDGSSSSLFRVLAVAQGNPRLDLRRARIGTTDAIYVLGRREDDELS